MTTLNLHFNHKDYPNKKINESISAILESNVLLSMATIKYNKESYINTAYYAYGKSLNLYYLSPPSAQHSKNLVKNSSVAISIFDSSQFIPTKLKRGLQIFAEARLAKGTELIEGFRLYSKRFSSILKYIKKPADLLKKIIQSKLYIIKPSSIKIFDEPVFGQEVWISVKIR